MLGIEGFPELFHVMEEETEKLIEFQEAQEEAHREDQLTESEKRAMAMARKLSKGRP